MLAVGCNGKDVTTTDEKSPSDAPVKVETTLTDATLFSFEQTSGLAKSRPSILSYLFETAYAASGNISCYVGEDVSFDLEIDIGDNRESLQIDAECGDDIELKIRRGMLQALSGRKLIREISQSETGSEFNFDFSGAEGFQFDVPYVILDKKGWMGVPAAEDSSCYVDYTFNYETGTVSNNVRETDYLGRALDLNTANNDTHSIQNPNSPNQDNNYAGCNTANVDFGASDFRFKDGKIEIDESGTKNFSNRGCALWDEDTGELSDYVAYDEGQNGCPTGYDSTYERFCVDDDLDGTCDVI